MIETLHEVMLGIADAVEYRKGETHVHTAGSEALEQGPGVCQDHAHIFCAVCRVQIGEVKYGKPILDRIIRPELSLDDAARCVLVSLDSTMKSNLSVGPPIDLAIVRRDGCTIAHKIRFDLDTPYFAQLREAWGRHIAEALRSLPKFDWEPTPG